MSFCVRRVRSLEAGEGEAAMQVRAPRRRAWEGWIVVGRTKEETKRGKMRNEWMCIAMVGMAVVSAYGAVMPLMEVWQQAVLVLLQFMGG